MTLTLIEADVIHRVFTRINEQAIRAIGHGNDRDGFAMARLLGKLEQQVLPFAHFDKDNPLTDPREVQS